LILNPSQNGIFKNILAPIDPERPDPAAAENGRSGPLSRKIMETTLFMARQQKSRMHILHCWSLPGEPLLTSGRTRIESQKLQQMLGLAKSIHSKRVDNLMSEFDFSGVDHSVTVLKGDAGNLIVGYAEENRIDLILMGSIGGSVRSGLLVGSTAEKVMDRAGCSVLFIKPPGFKTPVVV
jgi:universal stress protein E